MLRQKSRTRKGKDREESHQPPSRKSNYNINRNFKPCIHCMKKKIRCTIIPGKYPSLCVACEREGLQWCKGYADWANVSTVIDTIGRESDSNSVLQGGATNETARQPSHGGTTQSSVSVQGGSTGAWYPQQSLPITSVVDTFYVHAPADHTTIGSEIYPQGSADDIISDSNPNQWYASHTPYFAEGFGDGWHAQMPAHVGNDVNAEMFEQSAEALVTQPESQDQAENNDQAIGMSQFPCYEPFGDGENNELLR